MITPEQCRFHAAGHLAAAVLLVESGYPEAAKIVIATVVAYANHPSISAPPPLLEKLATSAENPKDSTVDLRLLEEWFVHPLNTIIENSARA